MWIATLACAVTLAAATTATAAEFGRPDMVATVAALRAAGFTAPDAKPGKNAYIELTFPDPDGKTILLIGPSPK